MSKLQLQICVSLSPVVSRICLGKLEIMLVERGR